MNTPTELVASPHFNLGPVENRYGINPTLATLENGNVVAVWSSVGTDNQSVQIRIQQLDTQGNALGPEHTISAVEGHFDELASVAALADGGFVVIWQSIEPGTFGNESDIYGQRFDANGIAVDDMFRVNDSVPGRQELASVSALDNGGFVVVWQSAHVDGDGLGVVAQTYDHSGTPNAPQFIVNATTLGYQLRASVAGLQNGRFVVTWESEDSDTSDIIQLGQVFDQNGTRIADEFVIAADNPGIFVEVTALSNGGFVAVWTSNRVHAQRYTEDGTPIGDVIRIENSPAGHEILPLAAATEDGGFIIAWNAAHFGIEAQRFDAQGTPIGSSVTSHENSGTTTFNPALTYIGDGEFAIAWNPNNQFSQNIPAEIQFFSENHLPQGQPRIEGSLAIGSTLTASTDDISDPDGLGTFSFEWRVAGDETVVLNTTDQLILDANDLGSALAGETIFVRVTYEDGNGNSETLQSAPIFIPSLSTSGSNASELLTGTADNDLILGLGGADTLYGGPGSDTLEGGDGNDLLGGSAGNDRLLGGGGDDRAFTAAGDDTAYGGDGDDVLGGAGGDDLLVGELGADALWGSDGNDTLLGGAGADTLGGSVGNDSLDGGDAADALWGSAGNDTLLGGAGNDTLGGADGTDSLVGGTGNDELWGAAGNDTLSGGDGDDRIGAGTQDDQVSGGAGNDEIFGGLGHDILRGDAGNDTLFGAGGDDVIDGGAGNDEMYAGPGADVIVFSGGSDTALFFSAADDRVDLSGVGAIGDFADLQANHLTEVGGSAVIDDGAGNALTLQNIAIASLGADDFIF